MKFNKMKILTSKGVLKLALTLIWSLLFIVIGLSQHVHTQEIVDNAGIVVSSSEGVCFRYTPYLAWNLGLSDFIIFLCYVLIPLGLWKPISLLPSKLIRPLTIFGVLLGTFIISCGLTHFISDILLFYSVWNIAVVFNWFCATASVLSAIYLWAVARKYLITVASNLDKLLMVKGSLRKLDELEDIVQAEISDELTVKSVKSEIQLIRLNLETLRDFRNSIQK